MSIRQLAPTPVWQWFADICAVPHPSHQEAALCAHIMARARAHGLAVRQDERGNVYLTKPAHGTDMAAKAGVILQAHIDMVAQKTLATAHDFSRDPIRPRIAGDWVSAEDTTLGADNGIGAAMALAVAFADDIVHPPLEVLLTVEEETGMGGVRAVRADWLQGRYLLNLDSEVHGSLYVGCAGGRDAELTLPLTRHNSEGQRWRIQVNGLLGGHSGIDIHRGRGNAITLLADTLSQLAATLDLRLAELHGGQLRNVIPREAWADIVVPAAQEQALHTLLASAEQQARSELGEHGRMLRIRAEAAGTGGRACGPSDSRHLIDLLLALPDGVMRWSDDFDDVVETSLCLSVAHTEAEQLHICLLMRSLLETPKDALGRRLAAIARLSGASLSLFGDYPGWAPDARSPLLAAAQTVFTRQSGRPPKIEVLHAGLECGLLHQRLPEVAMISFGPTIEGAHTPRERVHIGTVADCWQLLLALLTATPAEPPAPASFAQSPCPATP